MTGKPATSRRKTAVAEPSAAASKPPQTEKPASAKPAKKNKKDKKTSGKAENKKKVVRDSFTMPQNDYAKIAELKHVCLKAGMHVKKSELLRAGLHALGRLSVTQLKQAIARVEQIKTGRPPKKS